MVSLSSKDLLASFNSILRTGLRYCHMIWNNLPTPVQISKLFDMPNNTYQLSLKANLSCEISMRMLSIYHFVPTAILYPVNLYSNSDNSYPVFVHIKPTGFCMGTKKNLICIGTKQLIKLTGHEWS